jgi:hypothetical protein
MNMVDPVCIVSGLPRSGTSMMMRMLEAGGVPLLIDGERGPDEDNPKGYFELERVKRVTEDHAWLADAGGCALKMISHFLLELPPDHRYKVVFMRRNIDEILASQRAMLSRRGAPDPLVSEPYARRLLITHLNEAIDHLTVHPRFETLYVSYNRMLDDPVQEIDRLNTFFDCRLNTAAMATVVDAQLYRRRAKS